MSKGSKRRPGKGYEDNYDKVFNKMNIYLVERTDGWQYDEFDSWVAICKDEKEAAQSGPMGAPYPNVEVTRLGVADSDQQVGVVHASFNAG